MQSYVPRGRYRIVATPPREIQPVPSRRTGRYVRRDARGMGNGRAAAGAAGGTAISIGTKVLAVNPIAGAAIIIGGAVTMLISKFIGKGCGQACIDASKAEQIYEAAADNLYAVGKLGMVSRAEAIAAMQMFLQGGLQHEAQLNQPHSKKGAENLTKVINAEIAAAGSLPESASKPIDIAAARSVYKKAKSGWYPDSIAAGAQLSDQVLSSLADDPARQVGTAITQAGEALEKAGIPPALAIVGVGALLWWMNR
jgi:hypothetical protein